MQVKEIYKSMDYSPAPESPDLAIEWLKENKSNFGLYPILPDLIHLAKKFILSCNSKKLNFGINNVYCRR